MFIGSLNFSQIYDAKTTTMLLNEEHLLEEFNKKYIKYPHHPYGLEKRLYSAILDGDLNEIERIGYEYSTYPTSVLCENNSIRSLKNNLICSCALITRIAIEADLDEKYAYFLSDLYINKIESLSSEETLLNLNAIMILDFMSQLKNRVASKTNQYSDLTKMVIQYINKNLYSNFTLTDVATYVNANSSYLSRIFKKEVGVSFTQYTHMARIKKAQHLLLFSDLSLAEISTKLGYTTQSHFSKVFKEVNGVSPLKFKQDHDSTPLH